MTRTVASIALADTLRAVAQQPEDPLLIITAGHHLAAAGHYAEAAMAFERALSLDADLPMAHNNLGWVLQTLGDEDRALVHYREALSLNGSFALARQNLASLLCTRGQTEEASSLWQELAEQFPDDGELLHRIVDALLRAHDVDGAAAFAERIALSARSSAWYPTAGQPPAKDGSTKRYLTRETLLHDIEQFRHLQSLHILGAEFSTVIDGYRRVLDRLLCRRQPARVQLDSWEHAQIGHVYGRIVHRRRSAAMDPDTLFGDWDAATATQAYHHHPLNLVVIDDFLSATALEEIRAFCNQSTVWFANHYGYGRLGAFFREGFNCPLLVQIGRELRQRLSGVIGQHHLAQIWGFKYGAVQPKTAAHADFAEVNVNFWITPDEANSDASTGGMVLYDVRAPASWDFSSYNVQGSKIEDFLRSNQASATTVGYRSNRAIIFDSSLFHATSPLRFHDGHDRRRINVTMLYGSRAGRAG